MKVITLWQPWASLVAYGIKTIETRSRRSPWSCVAGETIAIHAAKREPRPGECPGCEPIHDMLGDLVGMLAEPFTEEDQIERGMPADGNLHGFPLPLGALVATCTLVGVVPMVDFITEREDIRTRVEKINDTLWLRVPRERPARDITDQLPFGDFAPGRFALLLDNIVQLPEPIPCRGFQGLWTTSDLP